MINKFFKSVWIGLRRRWKSGFVQALGVVGAIWLVAEVVTRGWATADAWLDQNGDLFLAIIGIAAMAWFLLHIYEARRVTFTAGTTDFTVEFGNLLDRDADWLIAVNEFFDSELGQIVSPTSLHGQFITKTYNGDAARFRTDVDAALATEPSTTIARTTAGPTRSYRIGTTAVLPRAGHHAFLMAMSKTDPTTAKASSTVPFLWEALQGALNKVHHYGGGAPLALPLVGNGRSSVNIEPQHLLRLVVLALIDFGRRVGLPKSVTIVVPEDCFDKLDIREIRRDWSKR